MSEQYVIVGAGLAGAKAAQSLRDNGFEGSIVLVGDEDARPYERPPLSKGLLLGTAEPDSAFVHDGDWYTRSGVELRTGQHVTTVDRRDRAVELGDGTRVPYDRLLLATGARPRRLDVPGADLDGVLSLRTLADSRRLTTSLAAGARVVVIGAGWIGLEVAAAARSRGCEVAVVEAADLPLLRVLGDEVATVFRDLHRHHGVTFHFGASVQEIRAEGGLMSVIVADGTGLPADVVVVGVGVEPRVELAAAAGLTVANGIVVDASLRTSDPRIFAAGDVANIQHPMVGGPVRVEHWANAKESGKAAARAMLGQDVVFDQPPYFFTDQYDLGMEYCGYVAPGGYDRVVFRGDPSVEPGASPEFIAFWLKENRVLAAMNANIWDVQDDLAKLVRAGYSGQAVDPARLADASVPLGDLLG